MSRGLDHIVHAVHDLDAAAEFYRRLGFQVGARNRHSRTWGTQNHIVQLAGTFIELLTVEDTTQIAPHAPRFFSFGAFNRDFLARGQGLSMLVLEGRGAPDADEFRAAGIGDFELYEFEREGKRPDGTPIKVAFALAFASDPRAPDAGFFTCRHRHPENFWNPAFQVHDNTATAVAGVVLVAENPSDHHIFISAFAGERELLATSTGIRVKTPRGEIQIMDPAAFRDHFGIEPPSTVRGARLAALRFAVRDIDTAAAVLRAAGIAASARMERLIVGPDAAMGATLVFERLVAAG
jgi:catechol 2,3-dioxygenase-like lactoylglutathione lyase family enzyme